MARNSKAKTTRHGLSGQPDTQDVWGNGVKRLIDQGKLMLADNSIAVAR